MPSNFEYFLAFFRKKILDGERQIDIASSALVNRSTAYINKLYKGNPKSCPIDTQRSIADYFGLSHEEMIEKGKDIFLKSNPLFEKRSLKGEAPLPSTSELLTHLNIVADGLKRHEKILEQVEKDDFKCSISKKKLDLYNIIFENIDEGITFFNSNQEFVFSSNLHGLSDSIDVTQTPSIENILNSLNEEATNIQDVIDAFEWVYINKKIKSVNIEYSNEKEYVFRLKPVFKDSLFLGVIIINTLKRIRHT